jgi:hypothetical protein
MPEEGWLDRKRGLKLSMRMRSQNLAIAYHLSTLYLSISVKVKFRSSNNMRRATKMRS